MLKAAIEKILELAPFRIEQIGHDTYSDRNLVRVVPHVDRPSEVCVNSLDGIVQLVRTEIGRVSAPVFIQVSGPGCVDVYTTYDHVMQRNELYKSVCDVDPIRAGFRDQEQAIIELRSRFVPNEGSEYLLNLLSRITSESSVSSTDNGVTQSVEAKQGIALATKTAIKPRVTLQPYRTFLEVAQPASEFLLRLDGDGHVGLFEADGGAWKLESKQNIAAYFRAELAGLVEQGAVVVMM